MNELDLRAWSEAKARDLLLEHGGRFTEQELAAILRTVARAVRKKALVSASNALRDRMMDTAASVVDSLPDYEP